MKTVDELHAEVEAMTEEERVAVVKRFRENLNAVLPETKEIVDFIASKGWDHATVTTALIRLLAGSVVAPINFPDMTTHKEQAFLMCVLISELIGEHGNNLIQKYGEKDHADVPGVPGEGGSSGAQGDRPRA